MSSEDETNGYVHRPDGTTGPGSTTGDDGSARAEFASEDHERTGFGTKGWGLVAVLILCTLVVPGIIYLDPSVFAAVGVPYTVALLVLPLLPAFVLGLTAVWSMTGATNGTREEE